jgi:hypothetical protein
MAFERKSVNVTAELSHRIRVAANVELRVSESAIIEAAARLFLALSPEEQKAAIGDLHDNRRRRKASDEQLTLDANATATAA